MDEFKFPKFELFCFINRLDVFCFFTSLMMARPSLLILFLGTLRAAVFLHQHPPHNANQMRKITQPDKKTEK